MFMLLFSKVDFVCFHCIFCLIIEKKVHYCRSFPKITDFMPKSIIL